MLDTVNLGWKLAAQVQGWAPAGLLDSYHTERHPVGMRTLRQTRAQAALDHAPGEDGAALRELLTELVQFEQPLRHLADMLHCSDIRYDMPGNESPQHALLGRFVPDLPLTTTDGTTRVAELMRACRPVLLDIADRQDLCAAADGWSDRINVVTAHCRDEAPSGALLIRPDGYVAWMCAGDEPERTAQAGLRDALSHWFGSAK